MVLAYTLTDSTRGLRLVLVNIVPTVRCSLEGQLPHLELFLHSSMQSSSHQEFTYAFVQLFTGFIPYALVSEMNHNAKLKVSVPAVKLSRVIQNKDKNPKKPAAKAVTATRQCQTKKTPALKKNMGTGIKKSSSEPAIRKNKPLSNQKSSTPLASPTKSNHDLGNSNKQDKDLDALSDISKHSAPSSVCSSVSSGLIELLHHYNSKLDNMNVPEKDCIPLDETLKNDNTFSFVIPTDQPNCDGRIGILSGLLEKLKSTANSILSSGDSRNVKRLEKLIETMSKEFDGLKGELPVLWTQKREFESDVEAIVAPLKTENASLQRKIRILNQKLAEKDKQNQTDINLELETVQCMNNTLVSQVKKLTALLQERDDEKKKLEDTVSSVKAQNRKMTEDLLNKNKEFSKSQEIFSSEAGTIKTEVANALQKVDLLKEQLRHAETQNELMVVSVQEKDEEIVRLNDLNKGLQSSISRLLEDLQKARPHRERSSNRKVSSAILKNIEHVLNTPQQKSHDSFWDEVDYRPNHLTRSYPPPSCVGKENSPHGVAEFVGDPVQNLYKAHVNDDYENVLESSRLSSVQTCESSTMETISSGMRNQVGSLIHGYPNSSKIRNWDQNSVCSSFVSFTTRDENDFANGLAILDADIQRLQESLHDMSPKPS